MFFTVKREYWSCMGETALKKTQFNEDVAKARHQYRAEQDALMIAMRGGQRVESQLAQQTQFQQMMAMALRPVMQNIVLPVIRTFQATMAFVRNFFQSPVMLKMGQAFGSALAGMAGAVSKMAQNAASQILSFFFGHKKENDKTEEKNRRDRNDAAATDLFGKTMFNENNVEGAQNKFLGG